MEPNALQFAQVMMVLVASTAGFVGLGLVSRILWRLGSRSGSADRALPQRDEGRLQRLEVAVDSIAIEVERISEAQRFMIGLMSDPALARRAERGELPSPAGQQGRTVTPH